MPMRLAEPGWLVLLALAPLPWIWQRSRPRLAWPTLDGFKGAPRGPFVRLRHVPNLCRALAIAALAVALARPQAVGGQVRVAGRGVAIVVALDRSTSMNAPDFPAGGRAISRLEAARRTFARFVRGRSDDLIGLVAFANYPDLACPPTLDHAFLIEAADHLRPARPGDDGTNLGDALAEGLDALRKAPPRKKVLILLSDGVNRPAVPRPLEPEAAARLARSLGVTLHTIAVGRADAAERPEEAREGAELLRHLAEVGGGRSFVADDAKSLDEVFAEIDRLEKSPVKGTLRTRYDERFARWAAAALALLVVDRLASGGRWRRLP
jgi:Ca-activated chloride channel family protein